MADLGPRRKRIAQLFRMLGSSDGERKNAFCLLERSMQSAHVTWTDIGDLLEHGGEDKYTEAEMQEFAQAARAEGVEAGIKIGMTRARNGGGDGHITLPKPFEIAEYCWQQIGRMKDDAQREFIREMYAKTRRGTKLQAGPLGYLVSLYIKHGGKY